MNVGQPATDLLQLFDGAMRRHRDAEHLAKYRHADLDTNAGEEADKHRPRQEIGEEPELEKPRQQQQGGGEQRQRADERHVVLGAWRGHFDKPLEKIAAVAESAATTRWRDDPKTAKATSGRNSV
jgi:hypothetical protein